jgi:hypothetical protein
MSLNQQEVDSLTSSFEAISYKRYLNYGHVAGFYHAMLSQLMLGYSTIEEVQSRIASITKELQADENADALAAKQLEKLLND